MSEWIKCSEKMPQKGQECLAYATEDGENYQIINAYYGEKYFYCEKNPRFQFIEYCNCSGIERDGMDIKHVSHWMPLPSIPEN